MRFLLDWLPSLILLRKGHLNGVTVSPDISLQPYTTCHIFPCHYWKPWTWCPSTYTARSAETPPLSIITPAVPRQQCVYVRPGTHASSDVPRVRGGFSYLKSMNKGVVNMYKSPCSCTGRLCSLMQWYLIQCYIHPVNKYFLSTRYALGALLGSGYLIASE